MDNPTTPDVTPQTRDTLLEQLNFLIDGARSNLMDMKASLAIDGPLLKPTYTKEQVIKMLRSAYDLGATAHEESISISGGGYGGDIEVEVDLQEGGFQYNGTVTIEAHVIKEAVSFDDHNMTDEHLEEILKS